MEGCDHVLKEVSSLPVEAASVGRWGGGDAEMTHETRLYGCSSVIQKRH